MNTSPEKRRSIVETDIYFAKLNRLVEGQDWAEDALSNLRRVLAVFPEQGWPVRNRPDCHGRIIRVGPERDLRVIYRIEASKVVVIDVWEVPRPDPSGFD